MRYSKQAAAPISRRGNTGCDEVSGFPEIRAGIRVVFFLLEGHCVQEMSVHDITCAEHSRPAFGVLGSHRWKRSDPARKGLTF